MWNNISPTVVKSSSTPLSSSWQSDNHMVESKCAKIDSITDLETDQPLLYSTLNSYKTDFITLISKSKSNSMTSTNSFSNLLNSKHFNRTSDSFSNHTSYLNLNQDLKDNNPSFNCKSSANVSRYNNSLIETRFTDEKGNSLNPQPTYIPNQFEWNGNNYSHFETDQNTTSRYMNSGNAEYSSYFPTHSDPFPSEISKHALYRKFSTSSTESSSTNNSSESFAEFNNFDLSDSDLIDISNNTVKKSNINSLDNNRNHTNQIKCPNEFISPQIRKNLWNQVSCDFC